MPLPKLRFRLKTLLGLVLAFAIWAFIATGNSSTISIPCASISTTGTANFDEFSERLTRKFVELGFSSTNRPSWAITDATDADRWFVGVANGERIYVLVRAKEPDFSVRVVDHKERFWVWQAQDHAAAHKFDRELEQIISTMKSL